MLLHRSIVLFIRFNTFSMVVVLMIENGSFLALVPLSIRFLRSIPKLARFVWSMFLLCTLAFFWSREWSSLLLVKYLWSVLIPSPSSSYASPSYRWLNLYWSLTQQSSLCHTLIRPILHQSSCQVDSVAGRNRARPALRAFWPFLPLQCCVLLARHVAGTPCCSGEEGEPEVGEYVQNSISRRMTLLFY